MPPSLSAMVGVSQWVHKKLATARISLIDDQNQLGINDEDYVVGNGAYT